MPVTIPLHGTARGNDTEIVELTYELSINSDTYSEPEPISVPPHTAGESIEWATEISDLERGRYTARVTAVDAEGASSVTTRSFSVATEMRGITTWDSPGERVGRNDRAGWRFTPATAINVTHLRVHRTTEQTEPERILLHDTATGAIIAAVNDENTTPGWHENALAEPVQLESGRGYTISSARASGAGRFITHSPTGITMHEAVTDVRTVYGPATDSVPTGEFDPPDANWAEDYRFVDFRGLLTP